MTALRDARTLSAARIFGAFCVVALAGGCADSTIHTKDNVGGVDTLSLDAKQRLVLVGDHQDGRGERITCTEPMPDALVARAAVLAASGNFSRGTDLTVGAGVSGGSSETAGSIGYRDHTIQMLRDGYFRLCEAYMNGAIHRDQYESMVRNADTFMVVISALQVIGSNQVAPPVTLAAGTVTTSTDKDGKTETKIEGQKAEAGKPADPKAAADANAKTAYKIVYAYLKYRAALARHEEIVYGARRKKHATAY